MFQEMLAMSAGGGGNVFTLLGTSQSDFPLDGVITMGFKPKCVVTFVQYNNSTIYYNVYDESVGTGFYMQYGIDSSGTVASSVMKVTMPNTGSSWLKTVDANGITIINTLSTVTKAGIYAVG
jgi:hypothetical protein